MYNKMVKRGQKMCLSAKLQQSQTGQAPQVLEKTCEKSITFFRSSCQRQKTKTKGADFFMQNLNTIRKIDELGRINLPNGLMEAMGWEKSDSLLLAFNTESETVTLKLHEKSDKPICTLCKANEPKVTLNGVGICADCLERVKAM